MEGTSNLAQSAWAEWPIDREIVISRVIDAPRDLVYSAWTDPEQIQTWFGPEGFAIETKEIDLAAGGVWRFDMVAPDGTRFDNRMVFLRMEAPSLLEVEHGSDVDDDPGRFRMLLTLDEQAMERPFSRSVRCILQRNNGKTSLVSAPSNMADRRWTSSRAMSLVAVLHDQMSF